MAAGNHSSPSSQQSISDKEHVAHIEVGGDVTKDTDGLFNPGVDVSSIDERKLMRKVDLRTVPWLSFLYLLAFLDRTSIGNAKLYGMETDLHLNDTQYLLCLTVFFIPYALFEVPSNVILKRLRPSIWLSALMLLWGIMMTVQGLISNYGGLMAMRWLLGTFEAGLFPGVAYYLSCWYKRSEFGIRMAIFFSAATMSGAFGGLLAAAISKLDGVGGKPAWAWIFIIEGLATVVAGAMSFWIIVDFPHDAKFLTEVERTVVIRRLQGDNQFSAAGESLKWKYIKASWTDWKTYLSIVVYSGSDMPLYAFALFLPSIISQATPANLLTVPVYILACICTCTVGFLADRYGNRGLFNLYVLTAKFLLRHAHLFFISMHTGYIILISSRNATLSYIAVYLAACGIYPCIHSAWVSNNVEGSYKRSVSLAMVISSGNIQGAISSNVYRANQTPWYPMGHGLVLMYIAFGIISTVSLRYMLKAENARRERGERDEVIEGYEGGLEINGRFASVDDARREKGDKWSGYRYTL
ncbi:major facilitator superfamily domain-containing protein [Melanogaster broomeanus]|nr:major facilitator superfamily domain-containing protein [Melanogaster broomeanus]